MFNDERINIECGKIYSRGILLAVLITLLYVISRTITLVIQGTLHTVVTYTEAIILIVGIGILLVGALRFHKERDERTTYEQHMFYKRCGKIFIVSVLITYILTIPFTTSDMLGDQPHNHLLILLEVIGFLYLFYSFRRKEININYSFISECGWNYYRRVFMLIGGLCLFLLPPFLLAASWELVLNKSIAGVIIILLAYINSAIGLSIEYFFISLIEKTSYDSVGKRGFTLGIRITMFVILIAEFSLSLLQCTYVYFVTGNLQEIPDIASIGTIIAFISQKKLQVEFILIVLVGLAASHMLSQIKKDGLLYNICRLKMLLLAISALEATLTPIWYRALSEEAIRFFANDVNPWLNFVSFAVTLTMWILFVYSITKELQISRTLWIIPVLYVISTSSNIYFSSQNMLRIGTYCMQSIEFICLIFLIVTLCRYKKFPIQDN